MSSDGVKILVEIRAGAATVYSGGMGREKLFVVVVNHDTADDLGTSEERAKMRNWPTGMVHVPKTPPPNKICVRLDEIGVSVFRSENKCLSRNRKMTELVESLHA